MRKFHAATRTEATWRERGAVSFIMTMFVGFGIFVVIGALAMDLSATANRGQELQSASDAAALSAVVAYEETQITLVAGGMDVLSAELAARPAAQAAANAALAQNGVDLGGTNGAVVLVTFPPPGGRVKVSVVDSSVTTILGSIATDALGFKKDVQREATAEFLGCQACAVTLNIPEPFKPVNAEGSGDGYKPIEVGDRLYALNHNSSSGQIVCIDTTLSEPCWPLSSPPPLPASQFEASRDSYFGPIAPPRSPEMPLAAVVGDRIYWSTSTSAGHFLYCYDTDDDPLLDAPCTSAIQLGNDPRGNYASMQALNLFPGDDANDGYKDENRGGGVVEVGNKVFVFTDNHEIHCFDPGTGGWCSGYSGPFGSMPTGLSVFPDANPNVDGNHGSSIDRIVDEGTGFIYSTIHIATAVDSHNCATRTAQANVDDLVDQVVVLEAGGEFLSSTTVNDISMTTPATSPVAQWRLTRDDPADTFVYLESVSVEQWIDGANNDGSLPEDPETDGSRNEDDGRWVLTPVVGGFTISNIAAPAGFLNRTSAGDVIHEDSVATTWSISSCSDPARDAGYAPGIWVHCYNTGVITAPPGPCAGEPGAPWRYRLHPDASRFSGRLFFNYNATIPGTPALKSGVCSSGYLNSFESGTSNTIEVNCVSMIDGLPIAGGLDELENKIQTLTGNDPGAWGDPHYNEYQNRLFYPTQHNASYNLCWDFNAAPASLCGPEFRGDRPTTPTDSSPYTEDYGFLSKDNCVFALGHTAYFWAFQADDTDEPCVGATSQERIHLCQCNGLNTRWGLLDLSEPGLDLTDFDVFKFQLTTDPPDLDDNGTVLWPGNTSTPPRDRWHELKPNPGSRKINLDDELAALGPIGDSIRIVFYVEAQNDPFAVNVPQAEIKFLIRPRLVE